MEYLYFLVVMKDGKTFIYLPSKKASQDSQSDNYAEIANFSIELKSMSANKGGKWSNVHC